MSRIFILFLLLVLPGIVKSTNEYQNKAQVDTVSSRGFYKIVLTPEVVSYLKSDYSDIRLFDEMQKEVPYLFVKETRTSYTSYFQEIEIAENLPLYTPKLSRIVVANPGKKIFTGLLFIVRNTAIEPEVTIKGSDDKINWFFISRSYLVNCGSAASDTSEVRSIQFPRNNYTYFEITIPHPKGEAIQIIKAGYNNSQQAQGLYAEVPSPRIIQKDSIKKSFITIIFNRPYELDKIEFQIGGPDYFHRMIALGRYTKERNRPVYFEPWYSHTLSSHSKTNTWEFDGLRADTLFMEIENEDNPALRITSVKAFQLNKYLIAQLNSGESYELAFNNPEAAQPDYDLKYFSNIIPKKLAPVNISDIRIIAVEKKTETKPINQFLSKQMVWIIIIVVLIVLGLISAKLLKEMKNGGMK